MGDTLIGLFTRSIQENREKPAFSDYMSGTAPVRFGDLSARILAIHDVFRESGIEAGSKVAVLGRNSANWATAYLATLFYGAVVVPILPDFKPEEIAYIIEHSETRMLFCADDIFRKQSKHEKSMAIPVISLKDFRGLAGMEKVSIDPGHINVLRDEGGPILWERFEVGGGEGADLEETLAAIVYTSGTTGFSKGVMLPMRSLTANVVFGRENMPLAPGDTILSFLPMAHAFGCAFEFLFPFTTGCHITFLDKMPTPTILLKAFSEVRPRLILSVPLIIEKIYSNRIKPLLGGRVGGLFKVPVVKNVLHLVLRKKLEKVFGGNFFSIVIGGAPLNPEVEAFFHTIRFRFTVGYGMTECGPLISYEPWDTFRSNSVGRIIDPLTVRIDSADPAQTPGEIQVRGTNVMLGYYKNEAETRSVFTEDGWLRTGDLGTLDARGNISIRGRAKTMLLGPSGQNIYPEEIEARLNTLPLVGESLVVQRDNRLTALVFPEADAVAGGRMNGEELVRRMEETRKALNATVAKHNAVSKIEIMEEEFEKTPSKKIKRFLYS